MRLRRFLLHCAGWAAYGVILYVSVLPWQAWPGVWLDRSVYFVSTFLCSLPLWALCRVLWQRAWPWPRAMLLAALCSFVLGYFCTVSGELAMMYFGPQEQTSLRQVFFVSLRATSASFALLVWCGIYYGIRQYERTARAETLAREAELRALRYQLTPHFLCNTLNGISTLVGEGRTQDARRMIARLGDFLRATLEGVGSLEVPLAQEVRFMEQYLAIEQARLGERLRVDVQIAPEALDAQVPNLLLQPLVENAIRHGITPYLEGGALAIRARRDGDQIHVQIQNSSRGQPAPGPDDDDGAPPPVERRPGLGLKNTEERLRAAYGDGQSLAFRSLEEAGSWEVAIALPYHRALPGGNGHANGHGHGAADAPPGNFDPPPSLHSPTPPPCVL